MTRDSLPAAWLGLHGHGHIDDSRTDAASPCHHRARTRADIALDIDRRVAQMNFDNSFFREMAGFYSTGMPAPVPSPRLVRFNDALAIEIGLDDWAALPNVRQAALLSGNEPIEGTAPLAQAYAGHQFGGFSPSLGDGRALLLGEVIDRDGRRRDLAFKGSGRTAYSRGGDGKAALGPMLREYLIGEALHGLRIPTSRALAVVATGERVIRDRPLPGAVLTRVAASHLRIGTVEYFAARGDLARVRQLVDYAIARHDPGLAGRHDRDFAWLEAVCERQAALIAQWMNVGFIHGVMNTDNAALSGESIDFGPCAFMETYDQDTVFSSIDSGGRYAYGNQPLVANWNLARLAEAVLPLLEAVSPGKAVDRVSDILGQFSARYRHHWLHGMRAKLGLIDESVDDLEMAERWLHLLHQGQVDFTLGFRALTDAASGHPQQLRTLLSDTSDFEDWWLQWKARLRQTPPAAIVSSMALANPIYSARNHRVEEALSEASVRSDLGPFERLLKVLQRPFDAHPGSESLAEPASAEATACYKTFCGT